MAVLPVTAHALVKVNPSDPTEVAVLGRISPLDSTLFDALAVDAEQAGHPFRKVLLESPGGDIGLAMKIAASIERLGLDTHTNVGGICASACVLPLSAGRHVHIAAGSRIGVHQAQQGTGGEAWGSTYDEAAYLASKGVVRAITAKLLDTPPDTMAWATPQEMRAGGWSVDEQPVQSQQERATADVVEVPRQVELAPVVIPAPAEAAPQPVATPAVPPPPRIAEFRPMPAPADEVFAEVPARCRLQWAGQRAYEADCMVGHAADGSIRLRDPSDKKSEPIYLYPNGPASYLGGFDGRSFILDYPLTVSADRLCVRNDHVEGCAWTARQPTPLVGINALFAGLFDAAVETERRLGMLGD